MLLRLEGSRAIVTGGSRGIGKAIARSLAHEGVDVAIVARNHETLSATAAELSAESGRTIIPVACDTSSDDHVRAMVETALAQLGGIDILVNSAAQPGSSRSGPATLAEINDDLLWDDINVKVAGYVRCIREVVPHMAAGGGGRIINISGLAARMTGSTIGSIRNVAVAALTKNLADELAPQAISVVVVHPGWTRTEATSGKVARLAEQGGVSEAEIEKQMASANLIGRLVDASEIADIVTFLASPRSAAINGDAIAAGGGTPGAIYY
ncbi:MAG TPA: SDR family NAD(P)-dependent oxidoreductase [Galbitalea sp.]|nr:SDR family NAD(P)-dependent oxidoreductase [Galbitalea sp.]